MVLWRAPLYIHRAQARASRMNSISKAAAYRPEVTRLGQTRDMPENQMRRSCVDTEEKCAFISEKYIVKEALPLAPWVSLGLASRCDI